MRALTMFSLFAVLTIMLPTGIHAGGVNTLTFTNDDSYDFATQTWGTTTGGGDLYFYGSAFWANNIGQQGVQDLGAVPLLSIASIPTTGYNQFGVPAVVGHSYVSLANTGDPSGEYIFFQVTALTANSVTINWIYGSTPPASTSGLSYSPAPPSLLLGAIGLAGCGLFLAYRRKANA
jgi:hypothetical protein